MWQLFSQKMTAQMSPEKFCCISLLGSLLVLVNLADLGQMPSRMIWIWLHIYLHHNHPLKQHPASSTQNKHPLCQAKPPPRSAITKKMQRQA